MKKIFATMLLALIIAALAVAPAFAETTQEEIPDDAIMYQLDYDNMTLFVDYESCIETEDYMFMDAATLGAAGVSFMDPLYTYAKVVGGDEAISGSVSLAIKGYLDSRTWSLSLIEGVGDYVFFEFKIKIISQGAEGDTLFYICAHDPDLPDTASESSGGMIAAIKSGGEGMPYIANLNGDNIYTFPTINEVYTVAYAIEYGTNKIDTYVDGVQVATGDTWVGDLNGICNFRWDLHGSFGDTAAIKADPREIVIDDILITYGDKVTKAEYFATPEPTPEPTATPEPTDKPTEPPVATEAPTDAPKDNETGEKKGCKSVVVSSMAIATVALLGAVVVLKKKH